MSWIYFQAPESWAEPTPKLNPLFVAWLLGSPLEMTKLEVWATAWISQQRSKRSKSS